MKKSRIGIALIVVSVIAFNLVSLSLRGQDNLKSEKMRSYLYLQPNFGVSQFFGNLNRSDYWNKNSQFSFGYVLGYQLSPVLGFRGQFLKADLYSKIADQNKILNSKLWDAALHLTINVNEIFEKYNENRLLNFYFFSGAGINSYLSTMESIKPSTVIYQHNDWQREIFVPIGVGVSFHLSHNLALNLEYGDHITFKSDGLDFTDGGNKNDHYSYASAGIQIRYYSKDTDGDGVKDKVDACPEIPGKVELAGCPDTDNDGITDKDDVCPEFSGKAEFNGCPDTDGDSIPDKDDTCPNAAGKKDLNGCPDKDGDGIADKEDACPDVKGLAQFKGCPDTDGDGIPDKDDACPGIVGKIELNGCPDKDGDGVADKDDKCPDVAGKKELAGCPDRDGDGIIDNKDACPDVKGLAQYAGCPDTDGDGIPDNKDKCPDVAGVAANKGCPIVTKGPLLEKTVYFDMQSGIVIDKNIIDLNEIVAFMNNHPDATISVSGYANDGATKEYNFRLSLERMDNVINYLKNKGMRYSKVKKYFYGDTKPVANKKTALGNALNRRVEIKITK